jgi:hypothetical protein
VGLCWLFWVGRKLLQHPQPLIILLLAAVPEAVEDLAQVVAVQVDTVLQQVFL